MDQRRHEYFLRIQLWCSYRTTIGLFVKVTGLHTYLIITSESIWCCPGHMRTWQLRYLGILVVLPWTSVKLEYYMRILLMMPRWCCPGHWRTCILPQNPCGAVQDTRGLAFYLRILVVLPRTLEDLHITLESLWCCPGD